MEIPANIGKYHVLKRIAKGNVSQIVTAIDPRSGEIVAIKIISRKDFTDTKMLHLLENELRLSTRFNHPNLIKIMDIEYLEDFICIVMEYLPNQNLYSLITEGMKFSLHEQIKIASDIISGLNYLHERGISHRDIKPDNIMFDGDYNSKIIDYSFTKENAAISKTFCGSPIYMAPEIFENSSYDALKADIWSLGITLHVISTGSFPWVQKSEVQLIRELKDKSISLGIMAEGILGKIIRHCLSFDPTLRPSAKDLLLMLGANSRGNSSKMIASHNDVKRSLKNAPLPRISPKKSLPPIARSTHLSDFVFANSKPIIRMRSFKNHL